MLVLVSNNCHSVVSETPELQAGTRKGSYAGTVLHSHFLFPIVHGLKKTPVSQMQY